MGLPHFASLPQFGFRPAGLLLGRRRRENRAAHFR
jgi:hypothetical protein